MENKNTLLFEKSSKGRVGFSLPNSDCDETPFNESIDQI